MRYALLILAALCLVGCNGPTRINPGAEYAIYAASHGWIVAEFQRRGGKIQKGKTILGFHDSFTKESYIDRGLPKFEFAGVTLHEAGGHGVERRYPGIWDILDKYSSPGFPCERDKP